MVSHFELLAYIRVNVARSDCLGVTPPRGGVYIRAAKSTMSLRLYHLSAPRVVNACKIAVASELCVVIRIPISE